ncbi:MAG: dihydrolipoyl dehydrogenase [Rhodospirillaceae bacterium]|nr:dihydrolipoyl dehydrogenase [Rhodospirillaceae bacterium]
MVKKNLYDLLVLGGGPAGYVAAIKASQLGLKTACIEKENVGGICLNWGCIPTKALLKSAEVFELIKNVDKYGISIENPKFNLEKIVNRSREVSKKLTNGVNYLLKKNKVDLIKGYGKIAGKNTLVVEQGNNTIELKAKNIILATGARSRNLKNIKSDSVNIWNYKDAMLPKSLPSSILIIGSGAIGIEFASFYNALNVDVTVVEIQNRILPVEDEDVSEFAKNIFKKSGINIICETSVESLKINKSNISATMITKNNSSIKEFDKVILAVGIQGNIENIGIDKFEKIKVNNGHIIVDEFYRTGEDNIYAIGDLVGGPWLAHKAMHEAIICVEKIVNKKGIKPLNLSNIPGCTYSIPQVASIGMTEAQAKNKGYSIKVGKFPFKANGKAIALSEEEGFVKTIFEASTGELLGAHMIGVDVTELIQGYSIAKNIEATEEDIMNTVFPHPTLSEMMHESVLEAFNKAIHV